jgi:hypothetical protein
LDGFCDGDILFPSGPDPDHNLLRQEQDKVREASATGKPSIRLSQTIPCHDVCVSDNSQPQTSDSESAPPPEPGKTPEWPLPPLGGAAAWWTLFLSPVVLAAALAFAGSQIGHSAVGWTFALGVWTVVMMLGFASSPLKDLWPRMAKVMAGAFIAAMAALGLFAAIDSVTTTPSPTTTVVATTTTPTTTSAQTSSSASAPKPSTPP